MGKYRHVVSGRIVERDDAYARRSSAFEPADEDAPLSEPPCIPCGPRPSAGAELWGPPVGEPVETLEGE